MFSARFQWDARPNRLTGLLAEKRRAGAPILDLTESNPTKAALRYPSGILDALRDPRALTYDPAPAGSMEAREAVARYYAARGVTVDPALILLTASTSEAYAYLFKLLCNPGDEVLVPRPSYPLFDFLANLESVEVKRYPLVYDGAWSIDLEALRAAVTPRTRAIVVVNPNNPTGSYLKRSELDSLLELGIPLVSDEVFSDYSFGPDSSRVDTLANASERVFAMSGLSKIAGLPQMKLGWIVAGSAEALEKLEWIADTYLSVSTPVQCAAARLIGAGQEVQDQIRERTRQNLAVAFELMRGSAVSSLALEGGWYLTLRVPRIRSEEQWALDLLEQENVLVQPGFFYDFESEAYLVVSLLTETETFETGIRRLLATARVPGH